MAINNTNNNLIHYREKYWNQYQGALIPVLPPHIPMEVGEEERLELIGKYKPYFIRWTTRWDCDGETGFWYVIKDHREELAEYSSKIRNTIKKGIHLFEARIISREFLKNAGYEIYIRAFSRYHTTQKPMTEVDFHLQIEQLFDIGEWEFWGVFEKSTGNFAGYSMNWIYEQSCEYKTIKTDPAYLKDSSNYLLIHAMNKHYLNDRQFLYVNDGSRSLLHESNIQEFLQNKFHFRKAFCQLHIHYNPLLSRAVKLLFPFRKMIYSLKGSLPGKASTLLKHEEIIREVHLSGDQ